MKKVLHILCILLISYSVSGQQLNDYILRAKALNDEGNPGAAIDLLNPVVDNSKVSSLYITRAESRILKGDYSGAISDYNEASKLDPSSGEYGLARIYALKGDASTALYHLENSMKSPFKRKEKEILLDPAFGPVENTPAWRLFWKKEWYSGIEKGISEIEYCISSGKTDDANLVLESLRKDYNGDNDLVYAEALVSLARGKPGEVMGPVSNVLATEPGNEKLLRILAMAQLSSSNYAGASVTFSNLINNGTADAELLIRRAECYRKTGENEKAIADIEKYLGYYPQNRKALSLAGKTVAESGDNLKALDYFSQNLKLHPNDPECYVDRANAYLISRSWDWAIKDYSMALDLNPGNSEAWLNMGVAMLSSGRADDACHDFRKAFTLGNKKASEYISKNCIK